MVNAVNLTDGLDGLDSCVTFVAMLGYLVGASLLGYYHVSILATATAGACAGSWFGTSTRPRSLWATPAACFWAASSRRWPLCSAGRSCLFFGIVYIWDAMTVVIQRVYFKLTHGRRIFRMTPIHHAFEMRGWREVKIDAFFSLIALIGAAMGVLYIYLT